MKTLADVAADEIRQMEVGAQLDALVAESMGLRFRLAYGLIYRCAENGLEWVEFEPTEDGNDMLRALDERHWWRIERLGDVVTVGLWAHPCDMEGPVLHEAFRGPVPLAVSRAVALAGKARLEAKG